MPTRLDTTLVPPRSTVAKYGSSTLRAPLVLRRVAMHIESGIGIDLRAGIIAVAAHIGDHRGHIQRIGGAGCQPG